MKRLVALMLTGVMVFSMTACGSKSSSSDSSTTAESTASDKSDLDYVKDKGTLVVGITEFEPMDYKDDDGNWIGFDADMATAFAESLGVDVEFVEIDWDNKIMELDGKTIDCVWNGMTLTPEVTSSMECTNAYCNNAQVVIVPKDKADKYQSEDSIKDLAFAADAGIAGDAARGKRCEGLCGTGASVGGAEGFQRRAGHIRCRRRCPRHCGCGGPHANGLRGGGRKNAADCRNDFGNAHRRTTTALGYGQ